MTLVLKVNCRACNRECGDYKHLLDETVIDEETTTLAALLSYCTTLEFFSESDQYPMPEHICNSCVEHLLQSYLFKEMVLQTDREMRERLNQEAVDNAYIDHSGKVDGIEDSTYVDQEIDVGGVEQENSTDLVNKEPELEEDIVKNEKMTEDAAEYEMEEWLEMDEVLHTVTNEDSPSQQAVVEEEGDGSNSKENFVETAETNDFESEGYIIMEQDYQSDTIEDLEGYEKENELCDETEESLQSIIKEDKNKENKKSARKKFVKHSDLTKDDLKCQYCGKQFDKMCRLREHTYVHTGEKPHVCKICGKRSRTKTHYNVHMLTHSDEKRYRCSICGQHYRTSTSLRVHERKHSDIRPYPCTMCDKSFHTAEQRKMHIMMHTGERPFSCDLCGKTYRESHSLKQHMLTHSDKKPYQCEVCGKGLTQMSGYKRHMLLHTNEYPYSCDICGRPFRISSNLVTHKRLHLDVLPYQCTKCDKGFNNSTRLKKHMAQHDQEHSKKETFKPRKPRQDTVLVDTKMCKSRVVEIL